MNCNADNPAAFLAWNYSLCAGRLPGRSRVRGPVPRWASDGAVECVRMAKAAGVLDEMVEMSFALGAVEAMPLATLPLFSLAKSVVNGRGR